MSEMIRRLQKDGEYRFQDLTREESKKAAIKLSRAAMNDDHKHGIDSQFGIVRDAFGYYYSKAIV